MSRATHVGLPAALLSFTHWSCQCCHWRVGNIFWVSNRNRRAQIGGFTRPPSHTTSHKGPFHSPTRRSVNNLPHPRQPVLLPSEPTLVQIHAVKRTRCLKCHYRRQGTHQTTLHASPTPSSAALPTSIKPQASMAQTFSCRHAKLAPPLSKSHLSPSIARCQRPPSSSLALAQIRQLNGQPLGDGGPCFTL